MSAVCLFPFASVRVEPAADVSIAVFSGVFNAATYQAALAHAARAAAASGSVLARWERAAVAASPAEIAGAYAPGGSATRRAVGVVVSPGALEWWDAAARLMATRGFVRAVFLDAEEALRWCRDQATLFRPDTQRHRTGA